MTDGIEGNPYPGLRPFAESDASRFFGREDDLEELLTRIFSTRFLAVLGASGTGKSSLIRAGLVPVLKRETTSSGAAWLICTMRPQGDPFLQLATGLASRQVFGDSMSSTDPAQLLASLLAEGPGSLVSFARALLKPSQKLLLVLDQFEELFRYKDTVAHQSVHVHEAGRFVDLIVESASNAEVPIYVLLTMRAEYLSSCSEFPYLAQKISDGFFLLGHMNREQLRTAIVQPASRLGVTIADSLVNQVINDLERARDVLPSMQHTMMRLWDEHVIKGGARVLDRATHYHEGQVLFSIGDHAEEVYGRLDGPRQSAAERVFKALTTINSQNETVRNPATVEQIWRLAPHERDSIAAVIERFRQPDVSMLFPSPAEASQLNDEVVVDIAHESLVRQWKRLLDWAKEEAETNKPLSWIREDTKLWIEKNRNEAYRTSGQRLAEMGRWLLRDDTRQNRLNDDQRQFMSESLGQVDLAWLDEYELLRAKAEEYRRQGSSALLLRGEALDQAIEWQSKARVHQGRLQATAEQRQFIEASSKRVTALNIGRALGVLVVLILAGMALWGYDLRKERESRALLELTNEPNNDPRATAYRLWLSRVAYDHDQNQITSGAVSKILGDVVRGSLALGDRGSLALSEAVRLDVPVGELGLSLDGNHLYDAQRARHVLAWPEDAARSAFTALQPALSPPDDQAVVRDFTVEDRKFAMDSFCRYVLRGHGEQGAALELCFPSEPLAIITSRDGRYAAALVGGQVYIAERGQPPETAIQFLSLKYGTSILRWGFVTPSDERSGPNDPRYAFLLITSEGSLWVKLNSGVKSPMAARRFGGPVSVPPLGGKHVSATIRWDHDGEKVVSIGADGIAREWTVMRPYWDYDPVTAATSADQYASVQPPYFDETRKRWQPGRAQDRTHSPDGCCSTINRHSLVEYWRRDVGCEIRVPQGLKLGSPLFPLSNDAGALALQEDFKTLAMWDASCAKVTGRAVQADTVIRQIFENGEGTGFASLHADDVLRFWRIDNGQITPVAGEIAHVRAANASPKGRDLLIYLASGTLQYLDLPARIRGDTTVRQLQLANMSAPRDDIQAPVLFVNSSGDRVVPPALFFSSNEDRIGVVFPNAQAFVSRRQPDGSFGSALPLGANPGQSSDIKRIFFDHTGRYLATVNTNGGATVWEEKQPGVFVERVSFFNDEPTQCSDLGSADARSKAIAWLWEAATFSKDNSQLALQRQNGAIRVYALDLQAAEPESSHSVLSHQTEALLESLHLQTLSTKHAAACRAERNTTVCWGDFEKAWADFGGSTVSAAEPGEFAFNQRDPIGPRRQHLLND